MAEAATKLPVKTEGTPVAQPTRFPDWQPFEALRNQVDRLFHEFQTGFLQAPSYRSLLDIEPFWRRDYGFNVTPAIDIVERDKAFEVTAELPGLDVNNIDLQLSDDVLTIKGEKQEEKEEKAKDHYVSERRYGSFRRSLQVPGTVDTDRIEAHFKGGVLTVTLPKSPEAQKKQKTIPVTPK
ncbi:Hsp20/alpha crystallin family protein [Bradyrhizobium quebecense]|uniref:Hsp20/alpha crystallin family protein n=1 Tax=Bradyrhizobium quebecense TaxID=2748629 RepID=A0A973WIN9_9BRAD|nr:Hsp20/alpha crystallin family protein [Bradyrhizobium quebecense]UGA41476.1 Hsp20/alpha crystallin family protein [Bradyrhizobium quebecense]